MKLYTEEQVREAIGFGYCKIDTMSQDEYINSLTPIELPSDAEIESSSYNMSGSNVSPSSNFIIGAYWMKEQITKTKDR